MGALEDTFEHGLSGPLRLLWSGVWLAFLAYPIGDILSGRHSNGWLAAAWLALVAFSALYLRTMWLGLGPAMERPRRFPGAWLAALVLFTFVVVGAFGGAWGGMLIYLGVATGVSLAAGPALVLLVAIAAATVGLGLASGVSSSNIAFDTFLTSALGVSMLGMRRMLQVIVELREARDEVARLTALEQRTRFARDLHDVLGHNLSAIALKSQVARRTMTTDPAAARAAVDDLEGIARQSLHDVRELVSGYRQRSLEDELAAADELLGAAGVARRVERPETLPSGPAADLLAWAVREGTTNVLRHSRAGHCRITVRSEPGEASLEIVDDGTGPSG